MLLELDEDTDVSDEWRVEQAVRIQEDVAALSHDYRTSLAEYPAAMLPLVRTFAPGTGPFEADAGRIKQRRIAPA